MKFIDLFAGLGGFHVGLSALGHECVFACEIEPGLRTLYEENFNIQTSSDIRSVKAKEIPTHDILCAGFPCQPFSKAGFQDGLSDEDRGNLFYDIVRILRFHKPDYFILENVANLEKHDNSNTFKIIYKTLKTLGYKIDYKKLSPHYFGIPQIRDRIFIVGAKKGLQHFNWPEKNTEEELSINTVLDSFPANAKILSERNKNCLSLWQEFLLAIPTSVKLPSFPIWAMEFGATYPVNEKAAFYRTQSELDNYKGAFGVSLKGLSKKDQLINLPSYACGKQKGMKYPKWKQAFILQNRQFYQDNKKYIEPLLHRFAALPASWQKLEWNCQGADRNIWNHIIQFRASGVRVKRSNFSPSLVACTSTQIPIIAWEKRYLSVTEAAKLQSLDQIKLPKTEILAFKALGNAVNATLVTKIAERLINLDPKNIESTKLKHIVET